MATPDRKLQRKVRHFCEHCFGPDGKQAICKQLNDGQQCSLLGWSRFTKVKLEKAIKAQCRFCVGKLPCTSPKCALFGEG